MHERNDELELTMIDELDQLITEMQAICNMSDDEHVVEIACGAADLLVQLASILPGTLNKRRCHNCGRVEYRADNIAPYAKCSKCGSQDTRLIRPRPAHI